MPRWNNLHDSRPFRTGLAEGSTLMRCYAEGGVHEFPVEDDTGAYCPEHGVTLLWRGEPIAGVGLAEVADAHLDELVGGAGGSCSVVCRGASVSELAVTHALCRQPDCVCSCHVPATALRGSG